MTRPRAAGVGHRAAAVDEVARQLRVFARLYQPPLLGVSYVAPVCRKGVGSLDPTIHGWPKDPAHTQEDPAPRAQNPLVAIAEASPREHTVPTSCRSMADCRACSVPGQSASKCARGGVARRTRAHGDCADADGGARAGARASGAHGRSAGGIGRRAGVHSARCARATARRSAARPRERDRGAPACRRSAGGGGMRALRLALTILALCFIGFVALFSGGFAALGQTAASFAAFLDALWPEAAHKGITRPTFDVAFAGLTPDPFVLRGCLEPLSTRLERRDRGGGAARRARARHARRARVPPRTADAAARCPCAAHAGAAGLREPSAGGRDRYGHRHHRADPGRILRMRSLRVPSTPDSCPPLSISAPQARTVSARRHSWTRIVLGVYMAPFAIDSHRLDLNRQPPTASPNRWCSAAAGNRCPRASRWTPSIARCASPRIAAALPAAPCCRVRTVAHSGAWWEDDHRSQNLEVRGQN